MALTKYCDLEEVRAALGVNSVELPDTVLVLPVYEIGLVRELSKVSASLPVAFSTAFAASPRTPTQQTLVDAVRMFSVYTVARQVGVSLGAMVPKDVGDGKATVSRFSDSPYKDVLQRVDAMVATAKDSLLVALAEALGVNSTQSFTTPLTVFRAAKRGYDPVTGV